jgi:hypothetical protein
MVKELLLYTDRPTVVFEMKIYSCISIYMLLGVAVSHVTLAALSSDNCPTRSIQTLNEEINELTLHNGPYCDLLMKMV